MVVSTIQQERDAVYPQMIIDTERAYPRYIEFELHAAGDIVKQRPDCK